jgi:predicted pyridoxine 5'-phosphate oxidase superfamily flavin-nucleotide-binding protein
MPPQHAALLAQLRFAIVGSLDPGGQPWASMLSAAPGFIQAPDASTLKLSAAPLLGDPLSLGLHADAPLALLGIQLEARRRVRVNGRVLSADPGELHMRVDQSFGNCPQYITARAAQASQPDPDISPAHQLDPRSLGPSVLACIARADTCFVASSSAACPTLGDRREGVDVSHRGGPAGFLRIEHPQQSGLRLYLPDYAGNNAFNTLGNIQRYPRAGLLIPDFQTGALLQLGCRAELQWIDAERQIQLDVQQALYYPNALPASWSLL